jgi:hypothetical protein
VSPDAALAGSCRPPGRQHVFSCAHGAGCHEGTAPAAGTAPEAARSWLLIEHDGPWPADEAGAALPGPLTELAARAAQAGTRVQLIRRPGRRRPRAARGTGGQAVFAGWTAGSSPWLLRGDSGSVSGLSARLAELRAGAAPPFGSPATAPLYLVCTHGRRDVCCARLGAPLARTLSAFRPAQVWETTHVGGHQYAANLVILPHGLYYGPVDEDSAAAAITAYERGEVIPARYRGRAGQPQSQQAEHHQRMTQTKTFRLSQLD